MSLTINIKELRERWMKLYLNLMALKSNDPKAKLLLEAMQQTSAEYSEKMMAFFEEMEAH